MVSINIKVQSLTGKSTTGIAYTLSERPATVQDLISLCVQSEVVRYNDKQDGKERLSFLSSLDQQAQAHTGRVTFGDPSTAAKADLPKSIDNAILAFQDGLYTIFVDDEEVHDLHDHITLKNTSTITFIQLTFLAGRLW